MNASSLTRERKQARSKACKPTAQQSAHNTRFWHQAQKGKHLSCFAVSYDNGQTRLAPFSSSSSSGDRSRRRSKTAARFGGQLQPAGDSLKRVAATSAPYGMLHSAARRIPSKGAKHRPGRFKPVSTVTTSAPSQTKKQHSSQTTAFDWRNQWYPVHFSRDLPEGQPQRVYIFDEPVVLLKRPQGQGVVALKDRCPHRAAALSEGRMTPDGQLQCAYHGWSFDGESGMCTNIPQVCAMLLFAVYTLDSSCHDCVCDK